MNKNPNQVEIIDDDDDFQKNVRKPMQKQKVVQIDLTTNEKEKGI